jgi:DNA-binding IclR family transcriptional regulator
MSTPQSHLVKSARRVLEILEYFDDESPSATVGDISRELHYPQSSTSILLRCLRDLGFLYYNRTARQYRPTTRAALLGCWAEGGAYRGGKVVELVDAIADRLGETVVLSSACIDYAVHHIHAVRGRNDSALVVRPGHSESVLNSAHGDVFLSSYPDRQIGLALHRLNAEERDPARRVNMSAKLAELQDIRRRGCWLISFDRYLDAPGVVAMLMPRRKGSDRIVLSIVAQPEVISNRGEEILQVIREERDLRFPEASATASVQPPTSTPSPSNSGPTRQRPKAPLQKVSGIAR